MLKKTLFAGLISLFITSATLAETLNINVDTSSLAGQTGWIDLQFNPGDVDAPVATTLVSAFSTDGTVTGTATLRGNVTGDTNSIIRLENSQFFNSFLQEITFGSTLSFSVDWQMPAPMQGTTVSGTAFSLTLYDDQFNSLLSDPTWGAALITNLNGDGVMQVLAHSPPVTVTAGTATITPTTVPIPGTLALLLVGIAILISGQRNISTRDPLPTA